MPSKRSVSMGALGAGAGRILVHRRARPDAARPSAAHTLASALMSRRAVSCLVEEGIDMHRGVLALLVAALTLGGCSAERPSSWQGYVEGEYVHVASPYGGRLERLLV